YARVAVGRFRQPNHRTRLGRGGQPLHTQVSLAVLLGQHGGAALLAGDFLHSPAWVRAEAGAASAAAAQRRSRLRGISESQYSLALVTSTSNSKRRTMSSVMSARST